jgi:cellulose synthase/poly-beta-1,6-N-acetylglucosamine synthase-like glycosyltransferase
VIDLIYEIITAFFISLTSLIIVYLVRHYIFTFAVLRHNKRNVARNSQSTIYVPSVSILIPAHNEDHVISRLLDALTQLTYPKNKLQIIVIDDASPDGTGKIVDQYANQASFLYVLHRNQKVGGKGKAAAMNAGFALATGEIIISFDADYLPQKDPVTKLVQPFIDPKVGAVQGRPVVMNEPQNLLTRLAALERVGGYRVDQEARNCLGLVPQFGGTIGGFRASILRSLGGFDEKMLTEDTDLTFHIIRLGYKVRYVGDAECYEEAVDNWKAYWRQRNRWARGHMQVCFKHAFGVLASKKLNLREKIDSLLVLNIYFMPIVTLVCLVLGGALILLQQSPIVSALWFFVPVSFYSFVGNFAPFFEVSIGAYLDGRSRAQWLVPLLIFAFVYNILICTKAFIDVCGSMLSRKQQTNWQKQSI